MAGQPGMCLSWTIQVNIVKHKTVAIMFQGTKIIRNTGESGRSPA